MSAIAGLSLVVFALSVVISWAFRDLDRRIEALRLDAVGDRGEGDRRWASLADRVSKLEGKP